jgi:hypothetical protein
MGRLLLLVSFPIRSVGKLRPQSREKGRSIKRANAIHQEQE